MSPNFLLGGAVGYGSFQTSTGDRQAGGKVEGVHAAAYGAARSNSAYAVAMLDFGYFDNNEHRVAMVPGSVLPPVPGFLEFDTGRFASFTLSGQFETGYKFHLAGFDATPVAGVQFTSLWMNGFTETNNGAPSTIGLSFAPRNIWSVPAYLGVQFDGKHYFDNGTSAYGWLRTEWVHEFEPQRSINARRLSPRQDLISSFRVRKPQPIWRGSRPALR